jgi:hypothetical protein
MMQGLTLTPKVLTIALKDKKCARAKKKEMFSKKEKNTWGL